MHLFITFHSLILSPSFDVDVIIWLGEKCIEHLESSDEKALRLEEMFDTREPEEAFAVFEEIDWNDWIYFFSLIREKPDRHKGLVEVKLT